jgi:non-homologous end joining protein Ku
MRSVWTGSTSFGLIKIPIELFSGNQERFIPNEKRQHNENGRIM